MAGDSVSSRRWFVCPRILPCRLPSQLAAVVCLAGGARWVGPTRVQGRCNTQQACACVCVCCLGVVTTTPQTRGSFPPISGAVVFRCHCTAVRRWTPPSPSFRFFAAWGRWDVIAKKKKKKYKHVTSQKTQSSNTDFEHQQPQSCCPVLQ